MTVIKGGTVLTENGWVTSDVVIEGSTIKHIGATSEESGSVIDATDSLVGPGFVDLHTHLREPGQTWKEDFASGTTAAAAGGFTAVVAMPNTDPPTDSAKLVKRLRARVGEVATAAEVAIGGALTEGRAGLAPADFEGMYEEGVRIFSDDGDCVIDRDVLESVIGLLAGLEGAILAQHAEDHAVTSNGHMHDGEVSRRLGVAGLTSEAESDIVARDLSLIAGAGVHYHCQHVSAAATVELIRQAKRDGLAVTAEVTPHHLCFDHTALGDLNTNLKMYPPLRTPDDREALVEALIDGTIDAVATDHAPHTTAEKAVPFPDAPRGVIGLETAASATWSVLGDPDRLFRVLSSLPAGIAGLSDHGRPLAPGNAANIVVFAPHIESTYDGFHSKSSNTPFVGKTLPGTVIATVREGEITYQPGDVAE